MTRLFTLEISDDKNQIGLRLATQAALETEGITPPDSGLVAFQQYLQFKAPISGDSALRPGISCGDGENGSGTSYPEGFRQAYLAD